MIINDLHDTYTVSNDLFMRPIAIRTNIRCVSQSTWYTTMNVTIRVDGFGLFPIDVQLLSMTHIIFL